MTDPCQQARALQYALEFVPDTKPARAECFPGASRDGLAAIESVLCTEELSRRGIRLPDYETENRAMAALLAALADSPRSLLQTFADTLLDVFQAGSAGISLLTRDEKDFVWPAIAGAWQAYAGGGSPRDFGPCGDVLDRNTPLLFKHFERRYPYLLAATPLAEECLVLPFYVAGKAVGTIWLISHHMRRKFDSEDLRQLESFGRFASAAYRATALLDVALEQSQAALDLREDAVHTRQAMQQLRESEEHYRTRFESIDEGFCIIEKIEGETLDFRYIEANPALAAQFSMNDVVGKTLQQVLPDKFQQLLPIYDTVCRTGEPVKIQREFGSQGGVMELYAFRVEDQTHRRVAINFHDITERKQTEALLALKAAELASLYAAAPVGLFMFDTDLRFVRINRAMAELNGLPAEQHIGRPLRELLTAGLADATEPLLRQVLETGRPVLNHELHGATTPRSGEERYWLVSYYPVQAEDGTIRGVQGAVQEITERKQAEQALRESQRFLRSSLDALSGHIAVLDESGTILEINEAWNRFALENQGAGASIGIGVNYLKHCGQAVVPGGEMPAYTRGISDVIAGRRTRFEMEYSCHSPTEQRWFVMRVSRFQNPGPVRVIIVHDNCTQRKLAEDALRQSEERYRNLFNSIDEGFCIIEMMFDENEKPVDYRFLEVNPAFEKQSGIHDVTGKRVREILPDLEDFWFEFYGEVALTGTPVRIVKEVKALNSWLDIYAVRLATPENRQIAVIFSNVTERIKAAETLRQSEERFRALFDRGPIAMYSCDVSGVIQEFNRNAVVLWGREPVRGDASERFCGAARLYFPDGTPMSHAQSPIAAVLKGVAPVAHGVEVIIERPDGSRSSIIANIVPLKNAQGEITGAMNCMYDITERSRLERKTQEQAQALADLHGRKDEFLAMLSHELRNPLAPIASALQLLRLQKNETPLAQQALNVIERQVGQLKHLVDDLLEISRITSGSIRLRQERVSVGAVVERALETVQPLIAQRRHELTVSLPPQALWLHADATRLEQVLVNLLTNAAKYTDDGGRIWLSVEQEDAAAPAATAPMVVIRVRDSGIGIAPELLPHIFELFTQAERSIDRSQGGLGIGLCLVQRLVELHGGRVEANSVLGHGSEFVVRLPVVLAAVPSLPPQPSIQPAQPSGKGCRVLVVDDNVDAVQSLAMLLKISGHEVQIAYDGPAALQAALAMRPDVVVLDIGLPGLTGLEVAEQIRQQPGFQDTVLVAMTGYGRDTDRQRSQEAGFDYHLVKPASFRKVEQILARVGKLAA